MVKKSKAQKITFKSIVRLSILLIIIYILINILSQSKKTSLLPNDPTSYVGENTGGQIFSNIYSKLPQESRYQLEHFDQTFIGKTYKQSVDYIQLQLNGFPQKQIKQIKKDLIKNISDDLIKDIDNQ